jgi:hypothetical protein
MWRTTGFLMNLAAVIDLVTIVGFLVVLAGGKAKKRESSGGWKMLGVLLGGAAATQFCAMAIVAYVFENDDLFLVPGYQLDTSWYLCTVSACLALLCATGLAVSAYILPAEEGYVFLADSTGV